MHRRNIVTAGIATHLLIGQEFKIGTAVLNGTETADDLGVRAAVVQPGVIKVGDQIQVTQA